MASKSDTRTVLHVGCGSASLQNMPAGFHSGWREVRFDINPNVRPDILGTIADMSGVETASVDALYSSHNVEHVYPHEVPSVLAEFRRVLRPGGFAVITCPDLESVAAKIVENGLTAPLYTSPAGPITALDILYGHIASIARGEVYMAHRTGFSLTSLRAAVNGAGFARVALARRPAHFDLWAIAMNGAVTDDDLTRMVQHFTPLQVKRAA